MKNALPLNTHIHFIGIGGIGMSALAMILVSKGYSISGSDKAINDRLKPLIEKGIKIFKTQSSENIKKICREGKTKPFVVISSAIQETNEELQAAKLAHLSIIHRSRILSLLIQDYQSLVVAGSHGKTTTSTFLSTLFAVAKEDPSVAVGGIIPYLKSNYNLGKGKFLIAEADESDGTLTKFYPKIGIITNIELDHTDHYQNIDELINTMKIFGKNCKILVGNYDCKIVRENIKLDANFSLTKTENISFSAIPIQLNGNETIADYYENGKFVLQINCPIPGLHNLSNLLAAIAACRLAGIPLKKLKKGIDSLQMPLRRFQYKGSWKGRLIVDDYAHHPSEIKASIAMGNLMLNNPKTIFPQTPKRLIAVFQPHRFTRTLKFFNEFAESLAYSKANIILIAPIFAAGEKNPKNLDSSSIAIKIKSLNPNVNICYAKDRKELINLIKEKSMYNDMILNMGAGDINTIWHDLNLSRDENYHSDVKLVA